MKRLLIAALCSLASIQAQQPAHLAQLWQQARSQNLSLQLAATQRQMAAIQAEPGNAGLMPRLTANAFTANSVNNTKQGLANGSSIENTGAHATSYGAGVDLTWPIFTWGANRSRLGQLKTQLQGSQLSYTRLENEVAADLAGAYYQLVLVQGLLAVQDSNLSIGQLRAELAQAQYEAGRTGKADWLQAQVDVNADQSARLGQELATEQVQLELAGLLGKTGSLQLVPLTPLLPDTTLVLELLRERTHSQNPTLLLADNNRQVSTLALKEVRAQRYPRLDLNLGSDYLKSQNPASFVNSNRNLSMSYGLTASIVLWDGRNQRRREDLARLQGELNELDYRQQELMVENLLLQAWNGYTLGKEQWVLERNNLALAQQNLDIALERYRLGRTTPLDLRTAQISRLQAQQRELTARYQLKLYEIELKYLAGTLPSDWE